MDFTADKPIYLQIADYVCERILLHHWLQAEKIPSVRELAVSLSVNPNTVQRSYAWLEEMNVIIMQRGVGYFVSKHGLARVFQLKKQAFLEDDLPKLFYQMDLLGINIKELNQFYKVRGEHEKK